MNVILDMVSPIFLVEEAVVNVLPSLLIVLLLAVSVTVICFVLKKNRGKGSSRPKTDEFEIPESDENDD